MADGATATLHDSIMANGLTKSFGAVRAVRGLDLELERGSTVALLGPNGAGKTTTIDMLIGLTKPDAGTVSLFGHTPSEAVKAGMIGAMTQTGQLIDYLSGARTGHDDRGHLPRAARRRRGAPDLGRQPVRRSP